MLAVAAFFIGLPIAGWLNTPPDPVSRWYWWVVGALVAAGSLWLAYRTFRITTSTGKRVIFGGGGILVGAAAVFIASIFSSHGPIKWTYYTPDRFAQARVKGEIIVMDFTAEWCLNCKALESGVLHRQEVVKVLNTDPRVKAMKVDITGNNVEGKAKLAELQWVGIPLLAVFGPGVGYDTPVKMDSYTPEMVLAAIEKARGNGLAQRAP
jgi:thiol:disulfide interchange protein